MRYFKTILKATLSIGLLGYLIYLADPLKIIAVLGNIWTTGNIIYLVAAFFLFLLSLYVLSIRWQILVSGYGLNIPTTYLFKYYLIGLFFNNFLPTGIGGDVLRIYNLIQYSGERTNSFASVLMERLLGIVSTLILTIISILILHNQFKSNLLLLFALALMGLIFLFFSITFNERLIKPIESINNKLLFFRLGERIQKFLDAIRFYSDSKSIFIKILLISLVSQCLIILKVYCLAQALNLEIDLTYMLLVVPITMLLTMLPSINGIGFRDGGYVVLLGKIGISKAAALSLSFLTLAIPIIISVSGGLLFMLQKKTTRNEEVQIVEKNL